MDFEERLKRANGRLKAARVPVRIIRRNQKLYARGTFPPAPDSVKDKPHQQKLALKLPANPRGLTLAEARAKEIGLALENGNFEWGAYRGEESEAVEDWVKQFCAQFEGSALTWRTDYQQPFNKLPQNAALTGKLLRQTLERVKRERPNSRAQLRAYNAYRQLAAFANIPCDGLKSLKGNYSASEVDPRSLPTDTEIAECRSQIEDPGWRWLFGILATYGLRGHEAYKIDLTDFPTVRVPEDTKTGARFVWPLFPEWAKQWDLTERVWPPLVDIPNYTNGQLGTKTAKFFAKLPFDAYDLRHCYARRCFEFGYAPEFGAKMMGHSPDVHCRTYRRWIDEEVYYSVYLKGINGDDRPLCP